MDYLVGIYEVFAALLASRWFSFVFALVATVGIALWFYEGVNEDWYYDLDEDDFED